MTRETGPTAQLLSGSLVRPQFRWARVVEPADRALVLGSSQPLDTVDQEVAAASGIEVVRRRSGGGAVLVGPGQVLWVDFLIPAADPFWDADVRRAARAVGDIWARALQSAGLGPVSVWPGGMVRRPWSDRLCFAGVGPGEVLAGERKVVGISQRRTREGALFQTAVPLAWDPRLSVDLVSGGLTLSPAERSGVVADLGRVVGGIDAGQGPALVDALGRVLAG